MEVDLKKLIDSEPEILKYEIYKYVIEDIDFVPAVKKSFVVTGQVQSVDMYGNKESRSKTFAFVGYGCGITYLENRGTSKKADKYIAIANEAERDIEEYIYDQFTQVEKDYFKSIGNPVQAVISQDSRVQIAIYSRLARFAHEKLGLNKICYHSVLD